MMTSAVTAKWRLRRQNDTSAKMIFPKKEGRSAKERVRGYLEKYYYIQVQGRRTNLLHTRSTTYIFEIQASIGVSRFAPSKGVGCIFQTICFAEVEVRRW